MNLEDSIRRAFESHLESEEIFFNSPVGALRWSTFIQGVDALASDWKTLFREDRRPIVILGSPNPAFVRSIYAALRTGHAYVPVDLSVPAERLRQILDRVEPCLVVASEDAAVQAYLSVLSECGVPWLSPEALREVFEGKGKSQPLPAPEDFVRPNELAYIMFTSGSTGVPKGVKITRTNLEDFLEWMLVDFMRNDAPLFLNSSPFNFDVSIYSLFLGCLQGGGFVSLDGAHLKDPSLRTPWLDRHGRDVGVWVATPSFVRLCLTDPSFGPRTFSRLSAFYLIGETLTRELSRALLERFPGVRLLNFYGPTEVTVATTVFEVTPDSLERYPVVPIGFSKPGSNVYIDDGEIVVAGPNVSPGYLKEPEKTADRFFISNGVPAYRTGDLGHEDESGLLFCSGRKDSQIKWNGFRIELGDVETHLAALPGVRSAAVLAKYKDGSVNHLVGLLVPEGDLSVLNSVELKKHLTRVLSASLPSYMIPRQFVVLPEMPLNPNGKIDRKRLEELL